MKTLLFLLVVLITNIIQAITGFAGTLLALPPSVLLIGITDAKVILNFLGILTCLIIVLRNKDMIQWKVLKKIVIFMALGMIIGVWLFSIVKTDILLYLYGIMIVVIAVKHLLNCKQIAISGWLSIFVLIAAGIIHGMFVSGGALLVVYAASVLKNKHEFRSTIAAVWVGLNSILLIQQAYAGQITLDLSIITIIACIPAVLGVFIGGLLHEKISQNFFLKLTYILLLISGVLCFI